MILPHTDLEYRDFNMHILQRLLLHQTQHGGQVIVTAMREK